MFSRITSTQIGYSSLLFSTFISLIHPHRPNPKLKRSSSYSLTPVTIHTNLHLSLKNQYPGDDFLLEMTVINESQTKQEPMQIFNGCDTYLPDNYFATRSSIPTLLSCLPIKTHSTCLSRRHLQLKQNNKTSNQVLYYCGTPQGRQIDMLHLQVDVSLTLYSYST